MVQSAITSSPMAESASLDEAREIISRTTAAGGEARLLGGVAVAARCPSAADGGTFAREYSDIDLVTTSSSVEQLGSALVGLGYEPAARFNASHGHSRLMFDREADDAHLDIFVRRFTMCHELDLGGRLSEDDLTIPLADLLLTKLQVAELNEKDVTDASALLTDNQLTADESGINVTYLTGIVGKDWGWWRTVTDNLQALPGHLGGRVDDARAEVVVQRITELMSAIDQAPKSLRWKARAKAGNAFHGGTIQKRVTDSSAGIQEEKMSVSTKTGSSIPVGGGGDGLFVRQSSGLVREMGTRDSMGMGLSVLLLIGIFSVTSVFLAAFPNGDFYVPILVGVVVSVLLAFAYAQLVTTFPRGGGEYLYASRTFSPVVGAFVGGLVFLGLVVTGSTNIIQTCQIQVPFMFSALAHAFHSHALETFATVTLAKKSAWIITGIIIVGICAVICMRPIHTVAKWIFWTFIIGFVTTLLIAVILLFESRTGFINAFNAESGHNAYQSIIAKAHAEGFQPGIKWSDVVALLPVGALMFLGFTFGNYAAGEIKRPARTYKIAVFGAIALGCVGLLLGWAGMRHAAGIDFMQSSASLSSTNSGAYESLTPVAQNQGGLAYALLAAGDPVTSIIIGVGTLIAWLSMAVAFFMMCTRVIFALSFDRLLPTKLAEVKPKTHAPVNAVLFVGVVALAFVVVGNATTLISLFRNFLIISNAILIVGSVCAAAVPYRRPELFAASPAVIRGKFLGIPWITIVSSLSALAFTGLLVDVAVREQYSGGYSTSSIITLVVVATCGECSMRSRDGTWRGAASTFAWRCGSFRPSSRCEASPRSIGSRGRRFRAGLRCMEVVLHC